MLAISHAGFNRFAQLNYNCPMKFPFLTLMLMFLSGFSAKAQFWANSSEDVRPYPIGLHIDVAVRLTDPGIRLAVEYPKSNILFRTLRDGNNRNEYNRQFLWVPSLQYIMKPGKQHFILPSCEWMWRRKNSRGLFLEGAVGVGAAGVFGNPPSKEIYGNPVPEGIYAAPQVALGLGSDLFQITDGKYKYLWNVRLQIPCLYGKSKTWIPMYMIQAGFSFYAPKNHSVDQRYSVYSRTRF